MFTTAVPLVGGYIFIWASNLLFFLFLLLYTLATIGFATLLATLFSKTNVATVMSGVIFFMTYCPYFFIQRDETYDQLPYQGKIILCLFSNTALALGSRLFSEFEARGDRADFSTLTRSPIPGDQFAMMFVLIMLWFDFKIYTILAWYIDNVFPGDFGVPKPFYFLCKPSYWYTRKRKIVKQVLERNEFIESEQRYDDVGIEIMGLGKVRKCHQNARLGFIEYLCRLLVDLDRRRKELLMKSTSRCTVARLQFY